MRIRRWLAVLVMAGVASSAAGPEVWQYRVNGNLDEQTLSCDGAAQVSTIRRDDGKRCVRWRLAPKPRCRGSADVDWLHANAPTGEVCELPGTDTGWALTGSDALPGLASCTPRVTERGGGGLVGLALDCTWECRSAKNPCAGQAHYVFTAGRQTHSR